MAVEGKAPRNILLPIAPRTVDELVDWAVANCAKGGADVVHVLSVQKFPKEAVASYDSPSPLVVELGQPSQELGKLLTVRVADRLAAAGIKFKVCVLQYYSPTEKGLNSTGEAISYKADQLQADLVVVCKHQRGKLASLFVGSVTKYLQAHCKRPLLVL